MMDLALIASVVGVAVGSPESVGSPEAVTYRKFEITETEGGKVGAVKPLPSEALPQWAAAVSQKKAEWAQPDAAAYFVDPIPFVVQPPEGSGEPFHRHNHCPAITWCENGDLLAAWFNTVSERGTELTILASRLRAGMDGWDPAAEFFKEDDRNMTGTTLFHDGKGTLYHFNGVGLKGEGNYALGQALLLRTSADNGLTWTTARPISTRGDQFRRQTQMPMTMSVTPGGAWVLVGDVPSAVHISNDHGRNWTLQEGGIRGIHGAAVGLRNGELLVFARGVLAGGAPERGGATARMPASRSSDMGKTFTYEETPFPAIGPAQRAVLMRLREGPLLLVSFTQAVHGVQREQWKGMEFRDEKGRVFIGHGMFAALSYDEGATWPLRKLLTPSPGVYDGKGHTKKWEATPTNAEPKGYLAATQTPDNVIHLLSSGLHYRFNLPWLKIPNRGPGQ